MEKLLKIAQKYPNNWDENLLNFLSQELNISRPTLQLLLPQGLESLVDYYLLQIESSLIITEEKSIQTRVFQLLLSIFLQLEQDKNFSRKLLAAPLSLGQKMRFLWRGSQAIWNLVDLASDFSYYTRTASLATIYGRNLLVFSRNGPWRESLEDDFQKLGRLIKFKKSFFSFSS